MTAKREAELETENRMLREQVASLEKIIERMQPVIRLDHYVAPGCAGYPYTYWYPLTWNVSSEVPVTPFSLTEASGTVTANAPSPVTPL